MTSFMRRCGIEVIVDPAGSFGIGASTSLLRADPGAGTEAPRLAAWDTFSEMRPTVLIVDDHPSFRSFARKMLESEGFAVVGEARDGASAVDAAAALRPAIVLLDVQLPDVDGFEVAELLAAAVDPPDVVLISTRTAAAYGSRLETTTARGFLPKTELSGAALAALVS